MSPEMTIAQLAREAGVGTDTVRYYEKQGLLPSPLRRPSGYRIYNREALRLLLFIRRAQNLGLLP
jgi:MerR family copper efflux transcriptional regulator